MKKATRSDIKEKISKINLANITGVQLTKWIRDQTNLSLSDSFLVRALVEEAFRLGEIRGRALKK